MAKMKERRPRGQVKGWVHEAWMAGNKKAKDIMEYIKDKYNEVVADTQVYTIISNMKPKRGRKKSSPEVVATAPVKAAASVVALNGAVPVDALTLILGVKDLAGKAGGMKKLKAVIEAMS